MQDSPGILWLLADMICEGQWKWPTERHNLYPVVVAINAPVLDQEKKDSVVWTNKVNEEKKFSIKEVYHDLRRNTIEVRWGALLWFTQCIPTHSFILWLAIQGQLLTQDRLQRWGSYDVNACPLYKNQ